MLRNIGTEYNKQNEKNRCGIYDQDANEDDNNIENKAEEDKVNSRNKSVIIIYTI